MGRKKELEYLESLYRSEKSEFLVLYGRRRIGKTELLRQFSKNKEAVFYTCVETTDEEQLRTFSASLFEAGSVAAKYTDSFRSWEDAFSALTELPVKGKKVLVIDEFPYMARGNKSVPSVLQKVWDLKLRDADVLLILCGSSLSFIEKEVLSEKKPLYGRATAVYKLLPLTFREACEFFPAYDAEDKVRAYSILGGIPYYLLQFDGGKGIEDNIIRGILSKGSVLYSETEFLMRQEFRETSVYNAIIKAVAFGNTRLNDIYNATGIEKAKLSAYLSALVETGIVLREFPASVGVRQTALRERGLYKLSDCFFRFYYTFCFPYLSSLEQGGAEAVCKKIIGPRLDEYASLSFEEICREYVARKNAALALGAFYAGVGRWWNKSDEIDVFASSADGKNILLGECKFRKSPFDMHDFNSLRAKYTASGGAEVEYMLFSRSGFDDRLVKLSEDDPAISLVDAEELAGSQV